ncbi:MULTISPECIES: serine/threonine-protein kinase [unclassified Streptomyces]|uniref:serine/threonine-protein kinase n=1 Tax=unclassified Streptomyces TaxID=2593676 RepID=UPI001E34E6F6|nr:serine/threonine-protein kinase [Streptomyces sp. CB02980]MCB8906856.1 serine/threonine protein kinase [Streptomyces sp. CB02980]
MASYDGSERADHGLIGGRYRLGERLGQGGTGVVRRATDELLGRPVAVKTLTLDAGADPAGALREARVVARIRHPHVIVVHDVVDHDGRPALVMELVDGGSLADRLAAPDGALTVRETARLGLALLDALSAAHAHDVLHRDVKPANVLLEKGTGRAVLTDFGIASLPGATTLSGTGVFVGTPEYTAPERMQGGDAGPAADLWSLGALLCAAATGTSPFRRDSIGAVLHAVVYGEIRPPERLGPLLPVVHGLLERDPERRLTAEEARRQLTACLTGDTPALDTPALDTPALDTSASASRALAHPALDTPALDTPALDTPALDTPALDPPALRDRAGVPGEAPRRRVALALPLVAAVVAACVAAATVAVLLAVRDDRGPDAGPARTPGPTSVAPALGPLPAGYTAVADERGFTLAVPAGATRSTDGERVFYTTGDGAVWVGIRIRPIPAGGAIGAMRTADASGPRTNPGYRDGAVGETRHKGLPAARWEFTWDGFTAAEGPRHTVDLCWEQAGTLYDVWASAPVGRAAEGRAHLTAALDSFRTSGRAPGG